jgi:hypothetical protein
MTIDPLDDLIPWHPNDIIIPDVLAVKCEILELIRRREEGSPEREDPKDIGEFERLIECACLHGGGHEGST